MKVFVIISELVPLEQRGQIQQERDSIHVPYAQEEK
jgi:hypothetical protein